MAALETTITNTLPRVTQLYHQLEPALKLLAASWLHRVSAAQLAEACQLDTSAFLQTFSDWCGLDYGAFQQGLIKIRELLAQSRQSAPDLFATPTPAQAAAPSSLLLLASCEEDSQQIALPSWLGTALVSYNSQGITALHFIDDHLKEPVDVALLPAHVQALANWLLQPGQAAPALHIAFTGTPFQQQVWQAMLQLPSGSPSSYEALGTRMGLAANASRAVGTAVGANNLAVLVPCHRLLNKGGQLAGFRWGTARKIALLGLEGAALA